MRISTNKLVRLALLVSMGLILYVLEAYIPQPLPWARIGLANLATLLALALWGVREALVVAMARILLGSFLTGTLMSPVFPFALVGGLASLAIMGLAWSWMRSVFSIVGVSLLGALAHNMAQLLLAYVLYLHRAEILYLVPLLLLSSVATGFFVGAVVSLVTDRCALEPWRA